MINEEATSTLTASIKMNMQQELTGTDESEENSIDDELPQYCLSFRLIVYQILGVSGRPNAWKLINHTWNGWYPKQIKRIYFQ